MPHSNSNSEKCSMFVECLLICLFVHCLHLVRSKIEQIQRADRSMDVEWIIINIVYKYFVHTTNLFTRTLHFRFSVSAVDFISLCEQIMKCGMCTILELVGGLFSITKKYMQCICSHSIHLCRLWWNIPFYTSISHATHFYSITFVEVDFFLPNGIFCAAR